jgi:hypothetical protein
MDRVIGSEPTTSAHQQRLSRLCSLYITLAGELVESFIVTQEDAAFRDKLRSI